MYKYLFYFILFIYYLFYFILFIYLFIFLPGHSLIAAFYTEEITLAK